MLSEPWHGLLMAGFYLLLTPFFLISIYLFGWFAWGAFCWLTEREEQPGLPFVAHMLLGLVTGFAVWFVLHHFGLDHVSVDY
jgi:hypothetical protein